MSLPEQPSEGSSSIATYVERIVELQATVSELNSQIGRIRRDARTAGVDIDALNFLIGIRVRYPTDKGAAVVDRVIEYADLSGVEFERNPVMYQAVSADLGSTTALGDAASDGGQNYRIEAEDEQQVNPLRTLVVALAATVLLIWLVH